MFASCRLLPLPILLSMLTGCAIEQAGDGPLGSASSAALSFNALSFNALSFNALSFNALSFNALSFNALSFNALDAQSLGALQDPGSSGTLSRQLLEYTAGCALNPSQSISFSWTDTQGVTHQVTDYGQLGLAPQWADGPLTHRSQQELVSSCLAARTNYFGVSVQISVRGAAEVLQENTSDAELAAYPYVEGAFWGNLFTASPALFSCYNPATVANSEADERVCATGYASGTGQVVPCGMITLTGSCDEQCDWFDREGQFYIGCGDDNTINALTTGLLPATQ